MNCLVICEGRFTLTEGRPGSHHLTYQRFWRRYLDVFESVTVLGRLFPQEEPSAGPVEGPGITFVPLPSYVGPLGFLQQRETITRQLRSLDLARAAVILRVPGALSSLLLGELRRTGHPYGVEVIGDPHDSMAPGALKHPLRPFFRWWYTREMRGQCAGACAAAYVTESALQRRYPPAAGAFTTHYSSLMLPAEAIVAEPRHFAAAPQPCRLILVGGLSQLYKAPDVLLQAVERCIKSGVNLRLVVVGDGRYRAELANYASTHGLAAHVDFVGQVAAGAAVFALLDQADLFVLPSRQEGLPRAMIEAMARGLPCLGSTVGGIPELLPAEDLVPAGSVEALAAKIQEVATDPVRLTAMAARNLARARSYEAETLQARRRALYAHLRTCTEAWQRPSER
jgi:glycosyltransferase involved in cell wall biosynthesis